MTPKERTNQYYLWVLERIKEEILTTPSNKPLVYELSHIVAAGVPSNDTEANIVRKLHEWKAIKIIEESPRDWLGSGRHIFKLKVLEPKFTEVYSYYQGLSKNEINISKTIINTDKGIKYIEPKINNTPVKIVISDLKSMYQEIEHEQDRVQFFIKIAQYGKYILENQSTINALSPLYQEAQDDTNTYTDAWREFIDIWKEYSKDLIEKSEQAGIKDNPNDPLAQEIGNIKQRLDNEDAFVIESDLENYFLPYQTLIWKFGKINKYDLIIPKHLDFEDNSVVLQPLYSKARDAWDIFKYSREAKVWWAHYQISRVAAGILGLSTAKDYFKRNRVVDIFYKFEFDEIAKGNINRTPIMLFPDKFLTWVKRLHEYIIPRLENLADNVPQGNFVFENQPVNEVTDNEDKIAWSDKFHWLNNKKFYLDEGKVITFDAKTSDRLEVFKLLTNAQGNWVKVSEMAKKISKPHSRVRTILSQLNSEKLKKDGIISIIPKVDLKEPGAYRINLI